MALPRFLQFEVLNAIAIVMDRRAVYHLAHGLFVLPLDFINKER